MHVFSGKEYGSGERRKAQPLHNAVREGGSVGRWDVTLVDELSVMKSVITVAHWLMRYIA
jgi:hypothetical protein